MNSRRSSFLIFRSKKKKIDDSSNNSNPHLNNSNTIKPVLHRKKSFSTIHESPTSRLSTILKKKRDKKKTLKSKDDNQINTEEEEEEDKIRITIESQTSYPLISKNKKPRGNRKHKKKKKLVKTKRNQSPLKLRQNTNEQSKKRRKKTNSTIVTSPKPIPIKISEKEKKTELSDNSESSTNSNGKIPKSALVRRVSIGIRENFPIRRQSPSIKIKKETSNSELSSAMSAEELKALALLKEGSLGSNITEDEIKQAEEILMTLDNPIVKSKEELFMGFSEEISSDNSTEISVSSHLPSNVLDAVLILENRRKKSAEKQRYIQEAQIESFSLDSIPSNENIFSYIPSNENENESKQLEEDEFCVSEPSTLSDLSDILSDEFKVSTESSHTEISLTLNDTNITEDYNVKDITKDTTSNTLSDSLNNLSEEERKISYKLPLKSSGILSRKPSISGMESSLDMEVDLSSPLLLRKHSLRTVNSDTLWETSDTDSPVPSSPLRTILKTSYSSEHTKDTDSKELLSDIQNISSEDNIKDIIIDTKHINNDKDNEKTNKSSKDIDNNLEIHLNNSQKDNILKDNILNDNILNDNIIHKDITNIDIINTDNINTVNTLDIQDSNHSENKSEIKEDIIVNDINNKDNNTKDLIIQENKDIKKTNVDILITKQELNTINEIIIEEKELQKEIINIISNKESHKDNKQEDKEENLLIIPEKPSSKILIRNPSVKLQNAMLEVAKATGSSRSLRKFGGPLDHCVSCKNVVYHMEKIVALGKIWHRTCYRCAECSRIIDPSIQHEIDKKPYCRQHYLLYIR